MTLLRNLNGRWVQQTGGQRDESRAKGTPLSLLPSRSRRTTVKDGILFTSCSEWAPAGPGCSYEFFFFCSCPLSQYKITLEFEKQTQ